MQGVATQMLGREHIAVRKSECHWSCPGTHRPAAKWETGDKLELFLNRQTSMENHINPPSIERAMRITGAGWRLQERLITEIDDQVT